MGPHKTRSPAGEEGVHHKASPETARPHLALPMGPLRASGTLSSGRPNRQVRRWHDAVVTERAALKRGPRGSWCPVGTVQDRSQLPLRVLRPGGARPGPTEAAAETGAERSPLATSARRGSGDQGGRTLVERGGGPPTGCLSHLPGKAGRGGRKLGEIPILQEDGVGSCKNPGSWYNLCRPICSEKRPLGPGRPAA